jgi:hypothetical protein
MVGDYGTQREASLDNCVADHPETDLVNLTNYFLIKIIQLSFTQTAGIITEAHNVASD